MGLGIALTSVNVFGLFCWFEGIADKDEIAFRRHCLWRSDVYAMCERRLKYAEVYESWPLNLAQAEIRNIQFVSYAFLALGGLAELAISLHSIFYKWH